MRTDKPAASPIGSLRGFVVAGGRSSRMGRDKALLPWRNTTLLGHAIETVSAVTPSVAVLCGPIRRYEDFGVPLVVDEICGAGPIGGLYSALVDAAARGAERIVWLAVDVPNVTSSLLVRLVTSLDDHDAAMPRTANGLEPMCAAFRVTPSLDAVRKAVLGGRLALQHAGLGLKLREVTQEDSLLMNVNTTDEFERTAEGRIDRLRKRPVS